MELALTASSPAWRMIDEVGADSCQDTDDQLDFLLADAGQHVVVAGDSDGAEFVDQRASGLGQVEALDPPVDGVGAALDETGRFHAVDLAAESVIGSMSIISARRRLMQRLFAGFSARATEASTRHWALVRPIACA